MAIYRGPGGSGDAVNDSSSEVTLAVLARDAAQAAQAAAEASQAAAEIAETNAETAETNAETAETNAETAATAAQLAETNAETAQAAAEAAQTAAEAAQTAAETAETNAETAETNAETAATNAASSASAASTSETNAASSASAASTSATNASNSATAAATSATNASNSATAASTSATNAANSATAAQTAETNAETAETNAETAQAAAEAAQLAAETAQTAAELAETNAETAETNAATSANAASTSATNAATSETNAASSASSSQAAADAALAALDSFDDRYLGQKSTAPTVDNDGNALVTGALYFDTVSNAMKVWDGSSWLSAYASLSGALLATNNLSDLSSTSTARTNLGVTATGADTTYAYRANNLSDLASTSTARTNLGLGTAATTDSTAYATAAQGALADTALQSANIGSTVQAYDVDTAKLDVSQSWSAAQSFNGGATLGDASGDALTINSSAVSIPNGLNFDSNTFVIDAGNNRVGVGTANPTSKLHVYDTDITVVKAQIDSSAGNVARFELVSPVADYAWYVTDNSNALVLYDYNATAERMRINSSGNVGIGTSSPASGVKLDVNGKTKSTSLDIGTTAGQTLDLFKIGSSNYIWCADAAPILIGTNNAERMRIDSSGNLLVGRTSTIQSGNSFQNANASAFYRTTSATSNSIVSFFSDVGGTATFKSYVDTTGAFFTVSDVRTKKNIEKLDVGLATVCKLSPVFFNWDSEEVNAPKTVGFIAQEVEAIYPQAVTTFDASVSNGFADQKMMKNDALLPLLVKAIQEQQAIITDLKARIETLESK